MYSYILALWNHLSQKLSQQVIFHRIVCCMTLFSLKLGWQMEVGNVEVGSWMEKSLLCLRVMRKLTINGFKTPHQSNHVIEFVSNLYERVKHLLQYRQWLLSTCRIEYQSMNNHFFRSGQVIGPNETLLAVCEKFTVVHCKVLRDLLDQHPFSFVPFIRLTMDFVLHYLFQAENKGLVFDSFAVQCLNLVKGVVLCAEYKPAKVIEGRHHMCIVAEC